jgi:formylglycine-generating enzyme required for sulfatase activity
MAGKIFINYRCALNLKDAQLLEKILQRRFGAARVFLDTSRLEGGKHWLHTLEAQVDASAAMVALIGKGWAEAADEAGARRLDNPDDFVRFEIARAFSRKIPVLPVLIDGAAMPDVAQLPRNLLPLLFPQAMLIRAESANDDGEKIAARLKALIAESQRGGVRVWMAGGFAAAALAAGIAAGPQVQSALGLLPLTDAALRASLERAQKQGREAESEAGAAAKARRDTEANAAEALRERDRVQAELTAAREALSAADGKRQAAEARAAELSVQLKAVEQALREAQAALKAANERAPVPGSGNSFKDCPECPEMVIVPAGSLMMGSPENEPEHQGDEEPQHNVTLAKPFAVGRFAVTFAEWDACADDGGCGGYKPRDEGWGRADRPVINVNWDDAQAYAKWLSKITGRHYRLLSEAEREYVTRAGKPSPFWWGASISPAQANYDGNYTYNGGRKGEYRGRTLPVKIFDPNPWGLYQVHGNVREWVEDCWHDNYSGAPTDGSAWTTGKCEYRVLRGGSWVNDPRILRAAYRYLDHPQIRYSFRGFRVALGWQDLNR